MGDHWKIDAPIYLVDNNYAITKDATDTQIVYKNNLLQKLTWNKMYY